MQIALANPDSKTNKFVAELIKANSAEWIAFHMVMMKACEYEDSINVLTLALQELYLHAQATGTPMISTPEKIVERARRQYEQQNTR